MALDRPTSHRVTVKPVLSTQEKAKKDAAERAAMLKEIATLKALVADHKKVEEALKKVEEALKEERIAHQETSVKLQKAEADKRDLAAKIHNLNDDLKKANDAVLKVTNALLESDKEKKDAKAEAEISNQRAAALKETIEAQQQAAKAKEEAQKAASAAQSQATEPKKDLQLEPRTPADRKKQMTAVAASTAHVTLYTKVMDTQAHTKQGAPVDAKTYFLNCLTLSFRGVLDDISQQIQQPGENVTARNKLLGDFREDLLALYADVVGHGYLNIKELVDEVKKAEKYKTVVLTKIPSSEENRLNHLKIKFGAKATPIEIAKTLCVAFEDAYNKNVIIDEAGIRAARFVILKADIKKRAIEIGAAAANNTNSKSIG